MERKEPEYFTIALGTKVFVEYLEAEEYLGSASGILYGVSLDKITVVSSLQTRSSNQSNIERKAIISITDLERRGVVVFPEMDEKTVASLYEKQDVELLDILAYRRRAGD